MTPVQLPAVTNGTGTITYEVSGLPTGLMFTPATRMVSGTPTTPGAATVTYTATDSATPTPATGSLTFTITVAAAGTTGPGTGMGSTTATMTGMYTPGENTIEVTLAGAGLGNLYVQGKDAVIFTLTNAPAGVTVLGTNLPRSREDASSKKVTLILSEDLKSTMYGATRVTLAYGATGAGVEDENRIISVGATADDDTRVADIIAGALMEMDIPPMLPSGMQTEYEFTVGDEVDVTLPAATGGNGNLTYALASQSEDISDGEIAFTPGTRKLMGTPTTAGTYTVYYEVTDDNANLGMGEVDKWRR